MAAVYAYKNAGIIHSI